MFTSSSPVELSAACSREVLFSFLWTSLLLICSSENRGPWNRMPSSGGVSWHCLSGYFISINTTENWIRFDKKPLHNLHIPLSDEGGSKSRLPWSTCKVQGIQDWFTFTLIDTYLVNLNPLLGFANIFFFYPRLVVTCTCDKHNYDSINDINRHIGGVKDITFARASETCFSIYADKQP